MEKNDLHLQTAEGHYSSLELERIEAHKESDRKRF